MAIADADVLSAAAGDQAALARLYGRYNGVFVRIAKRIVRDEATAEDAAQTAWFKVAKNLRTFRGEASFATWATRVVMNESLQLVRSRNLRGDTPLSDLPVSGLQERRVRHSDAHRMLERLPDGYREVAELVYREELSRQEVAVRLGLTVACVKTRLARAMAMMRQTAGVGV